MGPVKSAEDGKYRLGVWVKEKTAGIGTLTYYRPYDGTFGALGHGITDAETGSVLKVAEGQLLDAQVMSLKEGRKGQPGEIKGIFYEADKPLGELSKNTEYGIFGKAYTDLSSEEYATPVHTADPDEVKKGDAWILTTLEKDHVEKFKIKIEKINKNDPDSVKNMVIRVTDKDLIEKIVKEAQKNTSAEVQVWWANDGSGEGVSTSLVELVNAYLPKKSTSSETTTTTETTPAVTESETETSTTTTTASDIDTVTSTTTTAVSTTIVDPITTTTTTTGVVDPKSILYGDITLDGKIDLVDAVMLNKAVADQVTLSDAAKLNADCQADGEINGNDSITLLRFLVKLENSLPVLPVS